MSLEMKKLALELFGRGCFEAASDGHAGEGVLINAREEAIKAIREVTREQKAEYFKEWKAYLESEA